MHADDICDASNCLRSVKAFDAQTARALRRETATPCDRLHAEGVCARNHLLPNLSRPDQSKRATVETARFGKLFLIALAATKRNDVIRYATVDRNNQCEGKLGDGKGVLVWKVCDIDA